MRRCLFFLDLLLYLFGDPIGVRGVRGNLKHDLPVEDTVSGVVSFPGGLEASMFFSIAADEPTAHSMLRIEGENATIRLGGKGWERVEEWTTEGGVPAEQEVRDHRELLTRVKRYLLGDRVEVVDGLEGLRAVRVIDAILSSFPMNTAELRCRGPKSFAVADMSRTMNRAC